MAAKMWDGLVQGNVSFNEFKIWLDPKNNAKSDLRLAVCHQEAFVELFQRNLRLCASRILNATARTTSLKKEISSSRTKASRNVVKGNQDHFPPLSPTISSSSNIPDPCAGSHSPGLNLNESEIPADGSGSKSSPNANLRGQQRKGKHSRPRMGTTSQSGGINCAASNHNADHRSPNENKRGATRFQQSSAPGSNRHQCAPASLGDFIKVDNQQKKGRGSRTKNNGPRRINPTRLESTAPMKKADEVIFSENYDVETAPIFSNRSLKQGAIILLSTEDWDAKMTNKLSNGAHKQVDIKVPSTEDCDAEDDHIQIKKDWGGKMSACFLRTPASDGTNVVAFTDDWDNDGFNDLPGDMGSGDFTFERILLKVERLKSQQLSAKVPLQAGLPAADFKLPPALLEKVTGKDRLDVLIDVYCYLIDAKLTLNPSTEMCFLANLLVVSEEPGTEPVPATLLDSVHNCVYFAGSVLERESHLLVMFDRTSLKLLLRNDRISKCTPKFKERIEQLFEVVKGFKEYPNRDGTLANVNFKCETDNRDNFPSEYLFHSFKKQRDLFYGALQTWEKKHNLPRWSFNQALGALVKTIVCGGNEEPVNLVHFCRLFRDQLLGNCSGTLESGEDDLDEETRCFLKSLKSQDPNKYARLHDRLSCPRGTNNSQRTDFPGHQEFFKDFILSANNGKLNAHMIDAFISEISTVCSVNEINLNIEDFDESGRRVVDDATSQVYATSVASLQVLAKFLGFLVFLPYRSDVVLNNDIASKQAAARTNTHPPVDVRHALREAIACNNLVLTVPWVTKFLSMADPVAMTMPYYVSVVNILFWLYRTVGSDEGETCPSTTLLVQLSLGWLFETASFPGGQYFSWYFEDDRPEAFPGLPVEVKERARQTKGGLDCIPLASRPNVLQAACPGLRRITVMLATRGGNASRHVTPAAVPRRKDTKEMLLRKVEESFFRGQVPMVERTVFYVAERVGCSAITYVRTSFLPQLKTDTLEEHKLGILNTTSNQRKEIAHEWAVNSAIRCWEELDACCIAEVAAALRALLPKHTDSSVMEFSTGVATRIAQKKAQVWFEDNMTSGTFKYGLTEDIERLYRKAVKKRNAVRRNGPKTSHTIEPGARNVPHDENACAPSYLITELKDLAKGANAGEELEKKDLVAVLLHIKDVCQLREDLVPSAEAMIQSLLRVVFFNLALNQPELLMRQMPLVETLWALPELEPSPEDAISWIAPGRLHALSQPNIQPSTMQAYLLLLKTVTKGLPAQRLLRSRLQKVKETPPPYLKSVNADVLEAAWRVATRRRDTPTEQVGN